MRQPAPIRHAVEHDGTVPDETFVADRTAMEQHTVTDRDVAADDRGNALVAVDYRAVLHIGARADLDQLIIGPQHGIEPDTGGIPEPDVTDELRARRNVNSGRGHHRALAFEGVHHGATSRLPRALCRQHAPQGLQRHQCADQKRRASSESPEDESRS